MAAMEDDDSTSSRPPSRAGSRSRSRIEGAWEERGKERDKERERECVCGGLVYSMVGLDTGSPSVYGYRL